MRFANGFRVGMALSLLAGGQLGAQQKTATPAAPAKTGKAEITGLVVDSLDQGYLAGADVIIQGVPGTIVTDSGGNFRIGGLAPGTYQVGVFHPLLDTLGISLATRPFHLGPDSSTYIQLSVPSAATIIHGMCVARPRVQGTSAVIGHVNDPETQQPVKGAEVSIAWTQVEASKETGLHRSPRVIRDTTDASGAYQLCGLPSSVMGTLQAKRGNSVTAEIPIALGGGETELFARNLLLSPVDSGAKVGDATLSGQIVLEGAVTNSGTRVELVGTDQIALTNDKGEFTMTKLPSGSHVLFARHLGFGAQTVAVDLTSHAAQRVTMRLPKFVATLQQVVVEAHRQENLDRVGFNRRQRTGQGFYLGPEQLAKMNPVYLTDIFRSVPGLRVSNSGNAGDVVSSSRGVASVSGADCVQYFVDDMPWQSMDPGDINTFVNGKEVVAVEVYQGSEVPAQYTRAENCTTIVLWTRYKIRDQ